MGMDYFRLMRINVGIIVRMKSASGKIRRFRAEANHKKIRITASGAIRICYVGGKEMNVF